MRLLAPLPLLRIVLVLVPVLGLALLPPGARAAEDKFITLASTTSTEQSGLFKQVLPVFEKLSGIKVRVIAVGSGQALDQARRGDADVVLVHDTAAEEKFVAESFGVRRFAVMYNDFVVVGPGLPSAAPLAAAPVRADSKDVLESLKKIETAKAPFVSRGDKSGTHAAELRYWESAGIGIAKQKGTWYRECGCGMGPALNMAAAMNAYVLADRGTWLSFKNRQDLRIVVEGDTRLFNQYGVMLVNPARHPHVKKESGQAFIDWLVSPAGQQAIADYKIGGQQLFFPNAKR